MWELRIPFADRKFLRDRGLDLADPVAAVDAVAALLLSAPEKLVEIAYQIAHGQHPDVTPEQFARALVGGQTIWDLASALSGSVIDFFPIPRVRAKLANLLAGHLESIWTVSLTSAPASSGSAPTATPSAN